MKATPYQQLFRTRRMPSITVMAFFSRLPAGMVTIGLLLFTRDVSDSFVVPGLVVAAFAISSAASAPVKGAMLDRYGGRGVLFWTAALTAVPLVLLVLTRPTNGPLLIAIGALTGIGTSPISPAVRAVYARLLKSDGLRAAYTLDSIGMELVYLAGPALVGLMIAVAGGSATALLASAALTIGATVLLAMLIDLPAASVVPSAKRATVQPVTDRSVRMAIAAAVPQAAALGAVEVVVTAAALDSGQVAAVGVLLAVWAAGSIVGGLLSGALPWSIPAGQQYGLLLLTSAAGLALLTLAGSTIWMGILLFVAGLPTSAAWAAGAAVVAGAPAHQRGRAYGWLQGTTNAGAALGYAVAGGIVGWLGTGPGYVLGAVMAGLAGAMVLFGTRKGIGTAPQTGLVADVVR